MLKNLILFYFLLLVDRSKVYLRLKCWRWFICCRLWFNDWSVKECIKITPCFLFRFSIWFTEFDSHLSQFSVFISTFGVKKWYIYSCTLNYLLDCSWFFKNFLFFLIIFFCCRQHTVIIWTSSNWFICYYKRLKYRVLPVILLRFTLFTVLLPPQKNPPLLLFSSSSSSAVDFYFLLGF